MDADVQHIDYVPYNPPPAIVYNVKELAVPVVFVNGQAKQVNIPDLPKDIHAKVNVQVQDASAPALADNFVKNFLDVSENVDAALLDRYTEKLSSFSEKVLNSGLASNPQASLKTVSDAFVELHSDKTLIDVAKLHTNIIKSYSDMTLSHLKDYQKHYEKYNYDLRDLKYTRNGLDKKTGNDLQDVTLALPIMHMEQLGLFNIQQIQKSKHNAAKKYAMELNQALGNDPFGIRTAEITYQSRMDMKAFRANEASFEETVQSALSQHPQARKNLEAFEKEKAKQDKIVNDMYTKAFSSKVKLNQQLTDEVLFDLDEHFAKTKQLSKDLSIAFAEKGITPSIDNIDQLAGIISPSENRLPEQLRSDLPTRFSNWQRRMNNFSHDIDASIRLVNNDKSLAEDHLDLNNSFVLNNYKKTVGLSEKFSNKLMKFYTDPILGQEFNRIVARRVSYQDLAYFMDSRSHEHKQQMPQDVSPSVKGELVDSNQLSKTDAQSLMSFAEKDIQSKWHSSSDKEIAKAAAALHGFHQKLDSMQDATSVQYTDTLKAVYGKLGHKIGSFDDVLKKFENERSRSSVPEFVNDTTSRFSNQQYSR